LVRERYQRLDPIRREPGSIHSARRRVVLTLISYGLGWYFAPSLVAAMRKHHNAGAILVFNLLLGWTILGWFAALVWACSATPPVGMMAAPTNAKSPSLVTSGAGRLCPNCGTSPGADAAFCPQCGAKREGMNVANDRADI
jgi:hypothetical protein